jgi:hypothetical protein
MLTYAGALDGFVLSTTFPTGMQELASHIYTDDSSDDQLVQDVLDGMKETTSTFFFFGMKETTSTIFFFVL